ncbi:DUF4267 domain-containing protein [Evansella halocellulosilytica]|uniref:DUF4267 domain-containing protein n=1 Tax=Evansella halocellulosilytica TaxID=2011013 RepID=UPI000BB9007B|nr:DUF4267 domain-containing protein [Evansella halocellulosilytica]
MLAKVQSDEIGVQGWGGRSFTYWLSLLFSIGLIALGVNGLVQPEAASRAFGLGIVASQDSGMVMAKALRDLVLGLTIGLFVWLKMKKTLMLLACVSAVIPIGDGILVLTQYGGETQDSWQHFITAFLVLMAAFLLWYERKRA